MSDVKTRSDYDPPKGKLGNLRTLWGFLSQYKFQLVMAAFFLVLTSMTVLVIPTTLQGIVDNGFTGQSADNVDSYFLSFLAIVMVLAVGTACRFYYVTWLGERVVADIRKAVYGRLISLSPEYFEENRPGEIVSRLTADTTLVQTIVGSSMSVWARNLLIAIGGTVWLFLMNPKLMAIIALILPVLLVTIVSIGRWLRALSRKSQDRVADVGAKAGESLSALNIVQAFTREAEEERRFASDVDSAFHAARQRIQVRAGLTFLMIAMIFSAFAGVLYFGAQDVLDGSVSSGEMLEFIVRAVFVAGAFGALSEVYSDLQRAAGAAGRLAELLGATSTIQAPAAPAVLPKHPKGSLAFDSVRFAYPSRPDQPALDDFSLDVQPGETVALVGPSGAGKSTVLQLLLRFYDPQAGHIRFDGTSLTDLDPAAFREHLAFVPQETIIFADTIAENIRYGRLDASMDDIRAAAKAAAALDFITDTPDGFDTFLGERGARLSGGQRQRIAIARAILRDAPVLLLDEATSALDAESEQQVQTALDGLMQDRTTVVIAHRLSTVKRADRIIVMDGGKITAQGTHESLSAEGGLYKRLSELQFGDS